MAILNTGLWYRSYRDAMWYAMAVRTLVGDGSDGTDGKLGRAGSLTFDTPWGTLRLNENKVCFSLSMGLTAGEVEVCPDDDRQGVVQTLRVLGEDFNKCDQVSESSESSDRVANRDARRREARSIV